MRPARKMVPERTICRSVYLGLCLIGIWPEVRFPALQKLLWIVSLTVFQVLQYWYIILHFSYSDLSDLIDGLSTALTYSLLYAKLITFWIKRRLFHDILASMARDWQRCRIIDSEPMTRAAHVSARFSNMIIGLYSISILIYGVGVLVSRQSNETRSARNMFLKMRIPFKHDTSPVYELVMLVQFVHQFYAGTSVGILTALLVTIILHIGGQIDMTCESLAELSSKSSKRTLRFLIKKHQEIITFSQNTEQLFTYIALIQWVTNTLVICCIGFLIVISIGAENGILIIIKSLLFYLVINLEAFVFCFAGEYLSSKSKMIGDSAYKSLWYDLDPHESRTLLLLILRTQKSLSISIGKVTNLSLEQYATIVKASASYVSVLLAMY